LDEKSLALIGNAAEGRRWRLRRAAGQRQAIEKQAAMNRYTAVMNLGAAKLSVFFAAVLVTPAWAGIRIQEESTNVATGETSRQEILLDADRMRVNITGKDSTGKDSKTAVMFLTDGGRNRMVMLDKDKNEYREMDQQTMNQMSQQMQGAMAQMQEQMKNMPPEQREMMEKMMKGKMGKMPGQGAPPARTVYTSKGSGSVNGFSCTKYEGVRGAEKVTELCAAKPSEIKFSPSDFQVFEKMKEFMGGFQSAMANSPFAGGGGGNLRDFADPGFEGFPVQQTLFRNGQPELKMETKSIARASLSDADFSLGNAKKVEMPAMPAGRR
jgi:hypothetical protein